jgi:hypothetical protein
MTLPSSGQLAFSDIEAEVGTSGQLGMDWVINNTHLSAGSGTGGFTDMNTLHGLAWFQSNNYGNCNGSNYGDCNCNCGNIQCNNCVNCTAINCANCDSRAWLQPNCNCNCTYNCTNSQTSYNCNCNCDCFVCACACW